MDALTAIRRCRDLSGLSQPAREHLARHLRPQDLSELHTLRSADLVLVADGALTVEEPRTLPYRLKSGGLAGEDNVAAWKAGRRRLTFQLDRWRAGTGTGFVLPREDFDAAFARPELLERVLMAAEVAGAAPLVRSALRQGRALGDTSYDVLRSLLEGASLLEVPPHSPLPLQTSMTWLDDVELWRVRDGRVEGHLVDAEAMAETLHGRLHRHHLDHATWLEAFGPDEPFRPT